MGVFHFGNLFIALGICAIRQRFEIHCRCYTVFDFNCNPPPPPYPRPLNWKVRLLLLIIIKARVSLGKHFPGKSMAEFLPVPYEPLPAMTIHSSFASPPDVCR